MTSYVSYYNPIYYKHILEYLYIQPFFSFVKKIAPPHPFDLIGQILSYIWLVLIRSNYPTDDDNNNNNKQTIEKKNPMLKRLRNSDDFVYQ